MIHSRITRSRHSHSCRQLLTLVVLSMGLQAMAHAENSLTCRQLLDKVAEAPKNIQTKEAHSESTPARSVLGSSSDPWEVTSLTETEKVTAIECFLKAENDRRPAGFSGA